MVPAFDSTGSAGGVSWVRCRIITTGACTDWVCVCVELRLLVPCVDLVHVC
jgi:hypothetical protein